MNIYYTTQFSLYVLIKIQNYGQHGPGSNRMGAFKIVELDRALPTLVVALLN